MATKPMRKCKKAGCKNLTKDGYCPMHNKRKPERRLNANQRGYTYKWGKAAKEYLAAHPWCAECEREGRRAPATEVDHIIPHKGNQALFWDCNNWQGLCHRCHSAKTAREDGGFGNPPSLRGRAGEVAKPSSPIGVKKPPKIEMG